MDLKLICLLLVLLNGSKVQSTGSNVSSKKQTNDHFLQHLVNSVNKLMVQHAVDINTLEHKLKTQQNIVDKLEKDIKDVKAQHKEDMERLEKKHAEDLKRFENKVIVMAGGNLKGLKDSIELNKKKHSDDIQKIKQKQSELETKLDENLKKQDNEITKVTTKCTGDIQRLRNEVEAKLKANLKKGVSEMSAIRTKHNYDIQRLEKKHNDDSRQLRSVMVQPMIGFYVCYGRTISSGTTIPFDWVKTNIGNGWNRHYYRFTAPVRGLYFFTLHITISPKNLPSQFHGRAYIMRGNLSIRNVYSHHQSNINAMIPASGSVPVMLNAGEHIWAKYGGGRLYSDGGGQRTYFVGFLIQKAN